MLTPSSEQLTKLRHDIDIVNGEHFYFELSLLNPPHRQYACAARDALGIASGQGERGRLFALVRTKQHLPRNANACWRSSLAIGER